MMKAAKDARFFLSLFFFFFRVAIATAAGGCTTATLTATGGGDDDCDADDRLHRRRGGRRSGSYTNGNSCNCHAWRKRVSVTFFYSPPRCAHFYVQNYIIMSSLQAATRVRSSRAQTHSLFSLSRSLITDVRVTPLVAT